MSYFRENIENLDEYVPGFQPTGSDFIKINTNENPYPMSPKALKVLREFDPEDLRRYSEPTAMPFRVAAAKVHGVDVENILCTNGGDELLTLAFRAFTDEGRCVAYPVPTYSLYPVLAKIQNCPVVEVPFDSEFNLPSQLASTDAALTILCNPNAPSGTVVPVSELASLADELAGVLLIDEAYVDFADQNCIELVKSFDNVMILRSLSKGYSLAGLRFGYCIGSANLVAGLMKIKDSYNVDALACAIATAAIEDQAYFKENVKKVCSERDVLTEKLQQMGFEVRESHTNFLLVTCKQIDAKELYENLANRNIYIRYFKLPGLENKVRITVGTAEQNAKLVSAIQEIIG